MGETDNNIMGFTMNPYNRMLSAGGACGGQDPHASLFRPLHADISKEKAL